MLYLRALLFWLGFIVSTFLFGLILVPLIWPLDWQGRYRVLSQWTRLNIWWLKTSCGLTYRVHGREHLQQPQAAIVLAKHQSAFETLALQQILPPQVWVLKRELMRIPFFGWAISMVEPVPLDRTAGRRALDSLVEAGCNRLQRGLWVVMFPEGTRTPPGQRGRYRIGGAVLAVRSGHPIIPIAHNSGYFWARNSLIKHPGVVDVVIGPPIATQGREPAQIMAEVEDWIETTVAGLPKGSGGSDSHGDGGGHGDAEKVKG